MPNSGTPSQKRTDGQPILPTSREEQPAPKTSTGERLTIPPPPRRYAIPPTIPRLPVPPPARTPQERYNRFATPTHLDVMHSKKYFNLFLKRDHVTKEEYQNFRMEDQRKYVYVHRPTRKVNLPGPGELLKIKEPIPASEIKKKRKAEKKKVSLPSPVEMLGLRAPGSSSNSKKETPSRSEKVNPASPGDLLSLAGPVSTSVLDADAAAAEAAAVAELFDEIENIEEVDVTNRAGKTNIPKGGKA